MKTMLFSVFLTVTGLLATLSNSSPVPATTWQGENVGMDLDAYDPENFMMSNWSNGGTFGCRWSPNNIHFEDGQMRLTIDRDSSGYTGGEYSTKKSFGYGMYLVSMKPIKNPGVVSSFFTYSEDYDEIDIEFLGYDTTKVQFNYFNKGVGNNNAFLYDLGFDASESYHTYGFYWDQNSITWYVDDKPVYTASGNMPNSKSKIIFNVWPGKGVDSWLKPYDGATPLHAYYDWASYDAPLK